MGSSPKTTAAQRLLLLVLCGVMATSTLLLVALRSGTARRSATPAAPTTVPVPARLEAPEPAQTRAPEPSATAAARTASTASLPAAEAEAEPTFDPSAALGRVVARGQGVAEVEVRLFPAALERRERKTPLALVRTDATGRFSAPGLEPHTRLAVCLQHPDFEPAEHALFPGHEEELELEPTATVQGRVRSAANGAPLPGVGVALECWHHAAERFEALVVSTSDADGRWRLPWAELGIERFLVLRPGHLPEAREFQVTEDGSGEYEILLGGEELLTLDLYLLEDGTPLADTPVLSDEVRVHTDASGALVLPLSKSALAEGSLRLALALEGGPQTQGRLDLAPERRPSGRLRLPLARGGTVTGRVLDGNGAPIEGAQLRLTGGGRLPMGLGFPEGFWLNPPRGGARAGPDGRYALTGLAPREGLVQVRADHPEHPFGRSEPFEFARLGASVERDVRLERGATIAGEVRVDGVPASVRVYWNGERGSGWTRSNDQGAYRLRGLPAGELGLRPRLEDEDEDLPRAEDQTVFVEDGAELRLDFELDGGRQWVRGHVLDSLGAPVAEAEVFAMASESEGLGDSGSEWMSEEAHTESADDGSFALAVPDRAGLVLDVWATSGPARTAVSGVRPGEREVELVLPALAPVVLAVVDSVRREPVLGFQLYWRTSEDGRFERFAEGGRRFSPGPDGTFLAELPVGRLDLAVAARAQGLAPARREGILVSQASGARVEFELEPGVELTLELELPEAPAGLLQQIQRGRLALATEEQWRQRERDGDFYHQEVRNGQALRPDANGRVRLDGLASGPYRFINTPKNIVLRPRTFTLPPVAHHQLAVKVLPEPEKRAQQD